MSTGTDVLLSLFVAFLAAQVGAEIASRLRLPVVVGQIAAGIVVGPYALAWLRPNEGLELMSELGAILLLFSVGLETQIHELWRVGRIAFLVGFFGDAVTFGLGFLWAVSAGFGVAKAAFVAAAFVATSAGITAKVLQELGVLERREAKVILAAAVIDDILTMLLLGIVSALQTSLGVDIQHLLLVLSQAVVFVAVVAFIGTHVMRRSSKLLDAPSDPESPLPVSFTICLGLALAAANVGLAAIVGAFLAGVVIAETEHREALRADFARVTSLIVPFFFVATGASLDGRLFADPGILGSLLLVTALAIVGKLVGCGIGARSLGRRNALVVAVGMIPRGEVGVIVASIGQRAGIITSRTYAVIVGMALLTAIVSPPALKWLMLRPAGPTDGTKKLLLPDG